MQILQMSKPCDRQFSFCENWEYIEDSFILLKFSPVNSGKDTMEQKDHHSATGKIMWQCYFAFWNILKGLQQYKYLDYWAVKVY